MSLVCLDTNIIKWGIWEKCPTQKGPKHLRPDHSLWSSNFTVVKASFYYPQLYWVNCS